MKPSNLKRPVTRTSPKKTPDAVIEPPKPQGHELVQRAKRNRNKANTARNSAKVDHYLMEYEKAHGFSKSWELRERFERGDITLEDVLRR